MRPPLKPEQVIGKYRVVRLIAMGGMGAVYEVLHLGLERRDALKAMLPEFASRPELRARFIREAKVTNKVRHPGIVQIYEISELADGSPYFVMEYIDGETLAQRMDSLRRQPGKRQVLSDLAPLRQVASILSSCHAKGLIHRDLKPGNIMLVKDSDVAGGERAKLLDFGIVKVQQEVNSSPKPATEPQTQAGLLLGTPEYMAPEQWGSGQPVTEKVDVYALGVMAYRILSGSLPFVADSPLALGVLHVSRPHMPLRERDASLPIELCILVDRMLAKDANQRPSISEFVSTLDRMGDRSNYSELRSGQLVIPDSFSSGAQPVPELLNPGGPPPPTPRANVQQPRAGDAANAAPPTGKEPFIPSRRSARPETTTARGSEPAHSNIAVDFSSLLPKSKEQPARPPDSRGSQLYVADEVPAPDVNPTEPVKPISPRWLRLGLVGLLLVFGLLILRFKSLPPFAPPGGQAVFDLSTLVMVQSDAGSTDLSAPSDLPEDKVDVGLPVDQAPPAQDMVDGAVPRTPSPDMSSPKPPIKKVRVKVGIHCITSRDIPSEQQRLLVEGFTQSGVLLIPGERVTLDSREGRPHVAQMPPLLLDHRELLEYALRGLFPRGFPKLVVIQCPAVK